MMVLYTVANVKQAIPVERTGLDGGAAFCMRVMLESSPAFREWHRPSGMMILMSSIEWILRRAD
jgi:hypothetical protein